MNTAFVPELQAKLDLLETRIRQILDHAAGLKNENSQLKQELNELRTQLSHHQSNAEQVRQAVMEAEQWKAEVQELKTSRDQITETIEHLLIKIDDLQMELTGETPARE
jgi:chromosome segregation ATPase